jgi:hypothetical protein
MNRPCVLRSLAPLFVAALFLAPASAVAQEPVSSFDRLNTRVSVGDKVMVIDAEGRQVTGQISMLKDASITIVGDGTTTLPADRVRAVERRSKSVGKAALRGAIGGALAGGVLAVVASSEGCEWDCWQGSDSLVVVAMGAAAGTLMGAIIRGALPPTRRVVYRASVTGERAHLSLFPVLGPKVKGLSVVYSF